MGDVAATVAGTALALGAGAAFGTSSVLQYRASHHIPTERVGRPSLLVHLLGQSAWRWSLVLAGAAFAMQVAALKLLPLIFVQPLLVTGLLWYVGLFAASQHRRPDRVIATGSALCLLGLSVFLLLAEPTPGNLRGLDSPSAGLGLIVVFAAAVAACLVAASSMPRRWRSLPLAFASGICYGVTAGLVRSLSPAFGDGAAAILSHWQTYAIAVIGPIGVLLSQNAFQAGPLGAPALATITVTDPLVSVGVGLAWLGEQIQGGFWPVTGEVLSLALVAFAVFLLAQRAPHVRQPPSRDGSPGGGRTG